MRQYLLYFFILPLVIFSRNNNKLSEGSQIQSTQQISFTENNGQVCDQNYHARPDVLYSGSDGKYTYHIKKNGISYQLYKVNSWNEVEDSKTKVKRKVVAEQIIYRIDINWLNVNLNSKVINEEALPGCNNYYLEQCPKGVTNVKSYKGIFIKKIYQNIDLHYYEKEGILKYDYIVAPYADYKQIQLEIKGAAIKLQTDGSILFKTPLGDMQEGKPVAYQNGKKLNSKWIIKNNIIGFDIENYDETLPLIIDPPTRLWGTYYGGTYGDSGLSCTTDQTGNVYMAGLTNSTLSTIFATIGAHQQLNSGGFGEAFLVKFDAAGVRQWGTFYGGVGVDEGWSTSVDISGNVYLAGKTGSNTGTVIATAGVHQPIFGGGSSEAFLVKFNNSGVRQWGTYYGGAGEENDISCNTDGFGNVYLCGNTSSTGTAIATLGAHQSVFGGGSKDAFLVKFDANCVRQWGTFYGGNSDDYGPACATDPAGNVYLSGSTDSNNGTSIATPLSHQPSYNGIQDAYLVKFNSNGVRDWGTYYGGVNQESGLSCSASSGFVYLVGETFSPGGTFIATVGSHQFTMLGQRDAFAVQFDTNGQRQWGTYYGGYSIETAASCKTDVNGNFYMSGSTTSSNNIATGTGFQPNYVNFFNLADAFLIKFNTAGIRQWGTYYGGQFSDGSNACAIDASGYVYLSGSANSGGNTVIATVGSHQPSLSAGPDAFLAKFNSCSGLTVSPGPIIGNTIVCAGSINTYSIPLVAGATSYSWVLPAGWNGASTSNIITTTVVSATSGSVRVIGLNDCGTSPNYQSLFVTVDSIPLTPNIIIGNTIVCAGSINTYSIPLVAGATSYSWVLPNGWIGASISNIITTTASAINGSVIVTASNNCGTSQAQTLFISIDTGPPSPNYIDGLDSLCYSVGSTVYSVAPVPGATSYSWTLPGVWNGTSITNTILATPGTSGIFTVVALNLCTSSTQTTLNVVVYPTSTLTILTTNSLMCVGEQATITAGAAVSYTWSSGENVPSIVVNPTTTTSYTVNFIDENGCADSADITIQVSLCTEINQLNIEASELKVFPNPFSNIINILSVNNETEIQIYNGLGLIIYSGKTQNKKLQVDLSKHANGIYFIKVENVSTKVIKQ